MGIRTGLGNRQEAEWRPLVGSVPTCCPWLSRAFCTGKEGTAQVSSGKTSDYLEMLTSVKVPPSREEQHLHKLLHVEFQIQTMGKIAFLGSHSLAFMVQLKYPSFRSHFIPNFPSFHLKIKQEWKAYTWSGMFETFPECFLSSAFKQLILFICLTTKSFRIHFRINDNMFNSTYDIICSEER